MSVDVIISDDFMTVPQSKEAMIMPKHEDFPWYFQDSCVGGDGIPLFKHTVLHRDGYDGERVASTTYNFWLTVLRRFLAHNNLEPLKKVRRICINATFNNNVETCDFHDDHNDFYRHLLVYLNDDFGGLGRTIIKNDDGSLQYITPKSCRGAYFTKCEHSMEYPTSGVRYIAVFTFL